MTNTEKEKQVNFIRSTWQSELPAYLLQCVLLIIAYFIFSPYLGSYAIVVGILIFFAYRTLCNRVFLRHIRRSNKYMKSGNYALAIPEAEIVLAFFTKYPWIDRYKNLLLLRKTPRTLREDALRVIAICYDRLDDVDRANTYFERTVKEYPDSKLALYSLQQFQTERGLIDPTQNTPLVTFEEVMHRRYLNVGLVILWITAFSILAYHWIRLSNA